jgi:F-type H+-transporting ATPase subunit b
MRFTRPLQVCGLAFVLLLGLIVAGTAAPYLCAQESQATTQTDKNAAQDGRQKRPNFERELGKETREAAGEEKDENEQFRRSSSVTLVARMTGLTLEHAYWLCILFNFAIIAGVLIWVMKAKMGPVFRLRTQSLQKAMQEARKASDEANQRLAEIEARLSRLDQEISTMRTSAEQEAAAEETRLKAAAEEDARKVVASAEQEIAAAAKTARRELKAYAADLAVSLAQKQIFVDTSTDQALVRSFSDQLASANDRGVGGQGKDGN